MRTTVEHASTLLGTDVAAPRLSWVVDNGGTRQTAYQVRVDGVWDSGRCAGDRTVDVPYGGPPLRPHTRYRWRARVWDEHGRASGWSPASWWETGFLGTDWQARWIGAQPAEPPPGFTGASWVWSADTPPGSRWFRRTAELPAGTVSRALLVATADDDFTLYLDGQQVLHAPEQVDGWKIGRFADVTTHVTGSRLVLAAVATNRGDNPAGLLVRLIVEFDDGSRHEAVTDGGWRTTGAERPGWQQPALDDRDWTPATVHAPYGQGPWGNQVGIPVERPAPMLRRTFTLDKRIVSARLYLSGLAYYDAELNGRRAGSQVLDPGFTDYDDTVLYATHDVTRLLARDANEITVTLGRGFYGLTTPNAWGPTVSDSIYAGETYDARRIPTWRPATTLDPPRGTLRAQQHEPIEVAETVTRCRSPRCRTATTSRTWAAPWPAGRG